ncbi:CDP-alcohol phosphatidyltransferase family protein [Patescibacteria group bacterium]|nr:CDP-alcohol phosphatidyltransferase family protein [Patescibacteria group bacterium]MBU1721723.1 CDP-alcohol phosphatidyltransferase family protein [Patescibacteria group bacterium]MBU1901435.1 CDP-alcohol phosphatidyltransferase family protein [Patescibacteria group bacterium]
MKIVTRFAQKRPDLFVFIRSTQQHPHDMFIARTVLRFLPESVTPNQLTMVRFLGIPVVVYLLISQQYVFGSIIFLLVAFTDVMDGSLARTRDKITKFGMLFDPLADKLLIGSMVLVLAFQYFNYLLGIAILGIEIVFIMIALVAEIKFHTVKAANVWGKIKMVSQVCAVFITLLAIVFHIPYLFTMAAWIFGIAIGFAVISLFTQGI